MAEPTTKNLHEISDSFYFTYFAERTGTEEFQLDEDTADTLRKLDGFAGSLK